jgi:phosphomannomutase
MDRSFFREYGAFLRGQLKLKRPIKAVFDCSNGYAGEVLKEALKGVKAIRAYYLNDMPDGAFPGHGPNPVAPGALDELGKEVVLRRADFGAAFDGDADRVVFVDDKGREIDSDAVIKLYIERKKPKAIAVDLRIGRSVRRKGMKIMRTKVGNYYVKKKMIEKGITFGAERAGHYFFKVKGAYIDAAIMMAFSFANLISEKEKISRWVDENTATFRMKEKNYPVGDKQALFSRVRKAYAKRKPKWSELDGLSAEFKDFWFNIRPSSNEDLIRLNMEADTEETFQREFGVIESLIRNEQRRPGNRHRNKEHVL